MASLPNLNTANIGLFAFWQLGVAVNLADFIPKLQSYTQYDNGVDGFMWMRVDGVRDPVLASILVPVRIRTDGLIIAYTRIADEPFNAAGNHQIAAGAADTQAGATFALRSRMVVNAGAGLNTPKVGTTTILAATLQQLESFCTAVGKLAVTQTAVLHYDFQFPSANKFYLIGPAAGASATQTMNVTQPAVGNNILAYFCHARVLNSNVAIPSQASAKINGTTLCTASSGAGNGASADAWISETPAQVNPFNAPTVANNLQTIPVSGAIVSNVAMFLIYCQEA